MRKKAESPNVVARFNDEEKEMLVELAKYFHRSQTGILRVLVCEAVAVLRKQNKITSKSTLVSRRNAQSVKAKSSRNKSSN